MISCDIIMSGDMMNRRGPSNMPIQILKNFFKSFHGMLLAFILDITQMEVMQSEKKCMIEETKNCSY